MSTTAILTIGAVALATLAAAAFKLYMLGLPNVCQ